MMHPARGEIQYGIIRNNACDKIQFCIFARYIDVYAYACLYVEYSV